MSGGHPTSGPARSLIGVVLRADIQENEENGSRTLWQNMSQRSGTEPDTRHLVADGSGRGPASRSVEDFVLTAGARSFISVERPPVAHFRRYFPMANEEQKTAPAAAAQEPVVHRLIVSLVGGQEFTLNAVTNSTDIPADYVAFINAWREKKDVWFSPKNDPHFGVRVKDVSMYRYLTGRLQPKQEAPAAVEQGAK